MVCKHTRIASSGVPLVKMRGNDMFDDKNILPNTEKLRDRNHWYYFHSYYFQVLGASMPHGVKCLHVLTIKVTRQTQRCVGVSVCLCGERNCSTGQSLSNCARTGARHCSIDTTGGLQQENYRWLRDGLRWFETLKTPALRRNKGAGCSEEGVAILMVEIEVRYVTKLDRRSTAVPGCDPLPFYA